MPTVRKAGRGLLPHMSAEGQTGRNGPDLESDLGRYDGGGYEPPPQRRAGDLDAAVFFRVFSIEIFN